MRTIQLSFEEIQYLSTCMEVYRMQGLRGAEAQLARGLKEKIQAAMGDNEWDAVGWHDLTSSNLRRARYNGDAQRLEIEFQSGAEWTYLDVPVDTWKDLVEAPSPGKYFASEIKPNYEGIPKLPDLDPGDEAGP